MIRETYLTWDPDKDNNCFSFCVGVSQETKFAFRKKLEKVGQGGVDIAFNSAVKIEYSTNTSLIW